VTKKVVTVVLALALALAAGLTVGCGDKLPKDSLAKVGETYITQEQFDQHLPYFNAQYADSIPDKATDPEGYKDYERWVVDYLVTYELATREAQSSGLSVTDDEFQSELDQIVATYYDGDQADFEEELTNQKLTLDQFKLGYKESMLLQKVYEEVTKDVTTVPDEELAAYYEENKAYYFEEETRTARHILISPKASESDDTSTTSSTDASSTTTTIALTEADWAKALATAEKVRADLVAGADWTTEAAEYSDDKGTKEIGGDYGTVNKGETVKEFEDSVFSLAKDEISQPVKSVYGYHIIQVTGITEAKQYTLDEVKEDITSILLYEKKVEAWDKWIEEKRAEALVIYQEGMEPTTTTTASTTATTAAASTTTTISSEATTTSAGQTITTAAPTTTTSTSTTTTSEQ